MAKAAGAVASLARKEEMPRVSAPNHLLLPDFRQAQIE
jgi:hypothetical protein